MTSGIDAGVTQQEARDSALDSLKALGIKPVRVSSAHFEDYQSRCDEYSEFVWEEDKPVAWSCLIVRKTAKGTLYVDPTHPLASNLRSDAEHYAEAMDDMLEGDEDGWARSIINGAKTTAKNLKAAGV
jgi:hypothetical protein